MVYEQFWTSNFFFKGLQSIFMERTILDHNCFFPTIYVVSNKPELYFFFFLLFELKHIILVVETFKSNLDFFGVYIIILLLLLKQVKRFFFFFHICVYIYKFGIMEFPFGLV